jgi:hypothetical protein
MTQPHGATNPKDLIPQSTGGNLEYVFFVLLRKYFFLIGFSPQSLGFVAASLTFCERMKR